MADDEWLVDLDRQVHTVATVGKCILAFVAVLALVTLSLVTGGGLLSIVLYFLGGK